MDLPRLAHHLLTTRGSVRRIFPQSALAAIERAIKAAEAAHGGEIHVAIEAALHGAALLRGQSPRQRALEQFARLHVWDTEHNNGVLIYILLADRAVEIVADRHIHALAGDLPWQQIARSMEQRFAAGDFEDGALAGVAGVAEVLARHFPAPAPGAGSVPDRPTLL